MTPEQILTLGLFLFLICMALGVIGNVLILILNVLEDIKELLK
jgi:hypothetical protein